MNHLSIRFHRTLSCLLALTVLIGGLAVSARSTAAANLTVSSRTSAPADGPEFPDCSGTSPTTNCTNLQVFLLIDDSSSMLSTDPHNQRLEGVKNVLDILAKEYYLPDLNENDEDSPPNIQVSLIRFSSGVHHNSGWKTVNPQSIQEWSTQLEAFDGDLTVKIDYKQPQFTDFRTAFQTAAVLAAEEPQTIECPRLVMLFTDGMPNLDDGNLEGEALTGYMKQLQAIIQPTFSRDNDFLFITTFGSDKTFRKYWDREYKQKWEDIVKDSGNPDLRRVLYVPAQELAPRMEHIIVSTIGDRFYTLTPISGEPQQYVTEIPIAVESLRLTYYTINTNNSFTVTGPDGNSYKPEEMNPSIQVLQIPNPAPGTYQITTSAAGGVVTQFLSFDTIVATISSPMNPWLQFTNEQIGIQLIRSDGIPLAISPEVHLQAALTQASQTKTLALTPGSETFSAEWMPLNTNDVSIYACATLKDNNGETIVLYNGLVGKLQIDPVTLQAGKAEKGCVPTEKFVRMPLQMINARSQQPVSIHLPTEWYPSLSNSPNGIELNSTINEIDAIAGEYELEFNPKFAGDVIFTLKVDAILDGVHHTFFDGELPPIEIEPPRQLELILGEPATLGDRLSVMFYKWFQPSCIDDETKIVIGRRFFDRAGDTTVQIKGRFLDTSNNVNERDIKDFEVQLVSTSEGSSAKLLTGWTISEIESDFSTATFSSPGLGLYDVIVKDTVHENRECAVLKELPAQNILLINDFWLYAIILALILFLTLLVFFVLRRFRERRYGHEIPLVLWAIVLIVLNVIMVNMIIQHTFECELTCSSLIDGNLQSREFRLSLCDEGVKIQNLFEKRTINILWGLIKFTIEPFPNPAIPLLPPLAGTIDPKLEDFRQFITRIVIVLIALFSLVTALILKRLLTPEGREAILTYIGLWLFFFVVLCGLFYIGVVY